MTDRTLLWWYSGAAEQGSAEAQYNLGLMYSYGTDGAVVDFARAFSWYQKAAERDYAPAQNNIGMAHMLGRGVPRDETEAANWYLKAAKNGYKNAQHALGAMYTNGVGIPQNPVEGLAWTIIAASSGNETYVKSRNEMVRNLDAEATLVARKRSEEILEKMVAISDLPRGGSFPDPKAWAEMLFKTVEQSDNMRGLLKIVGAGSYTETKIITTANVAAHCLMKRQISDHYRMYDSQAFFNAMSDCTKDLLSSKSLPRISPLHAFPNDGARRSMLKLFEFNDEYVDSPSAIIPANMLFGMLLCSHYPASVKSFDLVGTDRIAANNGIMWVSATVAPLLSSLSIDGRVPKKGDPYEDEFIDHLFCVGRSIVHSVIGITDQLSPT